MFYEPRMGHPGLARDPFKNLIVPRPIAWVSSIDGQGRVNLAPYSFFNGIAEVPPMVMFAPGGSKPDRAVKDSRANIEETGEFVVNLVTYVLKDQMNLSSATFPAGLDELAKAGLTPGKSRVVRPPLVLESPVNLECRYLKTVELPSPDTASPNAMILGEVVGVHIADELIENGRVNIVKARVIARLGYSLYTVVDDSFAMRRPDENS
jgi:flavin reductase (DIM6/NTAB) family NADH-FMN oxidoreductase RutF